MRSIDDDWRKTCLMESCRNSRHVPWTVEYGRYHNSRVLPTILWFLPLRMKFPVEGLLCAGS